MSNFRKSFDGLMPLAIVTAAMLTVGGGGSYLVIKEDRAEKAQAAQDCQNIKAKPAKVTAPSR